MKIQEFRDKIKQCKKEDVEKIAAELYKMLPKSKKESEADQLIEDIISGKAITQASNKKKAPVIEFSGLKYQIELFLEYVDNGYYFAPNRVVPKAKRSKWRFEVKNFIKMINEIPADGEHGAESALLLRGIYKRLAYGCGYYTFTSEDPFQSIGIRQPDFYSMLVSRTFASGFTDENLKNMLEDATLVFTDLNSLHIELEVIYVAAIPTSDLKYKVIEYIKEYVLKYETSLKLDKKKHSNNTYWTKEHIEELCRTMLLISLSLCEPDKAISYFWKHVREKNKEVILFKMLYTIGSYDNYKLWIRVYEDALKKGIVPRESLEEKYRELTNKSN